MTRVLSFFRAPFKRVLLICFALFTSWMGSAGSTALAQGNEKNMDDFVNGLLKKMTVEEKIGQLNLLTTGAVKTGIAVSEGVDAKIKAGQVGGLFGIWDRNQIRSIQDIAIKHSRLHIPLIFGLDVIHGHKTIFPIPLGMSTSWDTALIQKSARIAATEASAEGVNWVFSPMVDIARDPRWGRVAEGAGEDPYMGAAIARAMVHGYQGTSLGNSSSVMACVKHFALYGAAEAGREYNTVDMSPIKMYQDYLPPYKAALDAGSGSIMTSFNTINGVPSTGNRWLLTDLLRKQWAFKGFTVSDYTALNEMVEHGMGTLSEVSALALHAGLDMDMVGEGFLKTLPQSLKEGKVSVQEIDQACRRILEAKYTLGLFADPYKNCAKVSAPTTQELSPAHRALADTMAMHSMVLLKNEGSILPLKRRGTIALIGPLADNQLDMLGTWTIAGDAKKVITLRQGLINEVGDSARVVYARGANITQDTSLMRNLNFGGEPMVVNDPRDPNRMIEEAVEAAKQSDIVLAALGESQSMTGEASSRSSIQIPDNQLMLLRALVATGKKVVLILFNGRPLDLSRESTLVSAILDVWAPGTEAGKAISGVLFNRYNPSGKLTMTFPQNVGQIPLYYNHKNTGRPYSGTGPKKFKSDYLDISNDPLFPFGFGLSYTQFGYSPIQVNKKHLKGDDRLVASVEIKNTGAFMGEETVQLYIGQPAASIARSVKELKGFQKIVLRPGEQKTVTFLIAPEELKFYNSALEFDWEPGLFNISIGTNAKEVTTASVDWQK